MALVLRDATLIDGTGRGPMAGATVIIEGDVITAVIEDPREEIEIPSDADRLDCAGKYVLPGLIDSHVHLAFSYGPDHVTTVAQLERDSDETLVLRELRNARECLLAGITTVRDCGDRHNTTLTVRDAINSGMLVGPRILASGMPLTITFGHLYFCGLEVEGVEQARVAVRKQAKRGVDHVKVMATGGRMTGNVKPLICQYSQAELSAVCEEARRLDKHVAAHVMSVEGSRRCVEAGVNTIEHCGWAKPDGSSGYDPQLVERMAEQATTVGQTVAGINRNNLLRGFVRSESDRQRLLGQLHNDWQTWREIRAAGVRTMLSSDAGVRMTPFKDIYLSLQFYSLMMDATPLETLRAVTQASAEGLELADRVGTVEVGKVADLLVLDADPLADLENVRRVHAVIKEGSIVVLEGGFPAI